jgi:hypothetical protein
MCFDPMIPFNAGRIGPPMKYDRPATRFQGMDDRFSDAWRATGERLEAVWRAFDSPSAAYSDLK